MIEHIITLIVGAMLILVTLILSSKQNTIRKTGITTQGIVYDLLHDQNTSFNLRYPIIRFTTLSEEWITETANIGMFPGFYKKGQKVTVVYNQQNPKQFIVDSKANKLIIYALLIAGCMLVLFGTYKLIGVEL
jgi:hypothetical protein